MRRFSAVISLFLIVFCMCSCSKQNLADMTTFDGDEYCAIVWNERIYVPYCAISKKDCGTQIGIVNGDEDDRVYEYKGYSQDEWIINAYNHDGAMLYKEKSVTQIPNGLSSEYEWNK